MQIRKMVSVAQLVRALDCGSRGRRFDPGLSPLNKPDNERSLAFIFLSPPDVH